MHTGIVKEQSKQVYSLSFAGDAMVLALIYLFMPICLFIFGTESGYGFPAQSSSNKSTEITGA